MLFDLTETLKKVFAQDSKYPFQRLTLAQIKVQAVSNSKVAPTDPEKALLDYLEQQITRGETLSAQDQAEYLRLLCKLKGDCREGSQTVQALKAIVNENDRAYVKTIIDNWTEEFKNQFYAALASENSLVEKINDPINNKVYTKNERIAFEVMDWAKQKFFPKGGWPEFAQKPSQKLYYQNWRYVKAMDISPAYINLSLGSREIDIRSFATQLNSTSFKDFFLRGFTSNDNFLRLVKLDEWLPVVAEAIKKSYDNGGKIYCHLDEITDFSALYDKNNKYFGTGTVTEIRYLADNDLIDMGKVEFRLEDKILPEDKLNELRNAIEKYQNKIGEYNSYKGVYGIRYK